MDELEDIELRRVLLEEGIPIYNEKGMVRFGQWVSDYPDLDGMRERISKFYTYVAKRNGSASTRIFGMGGSLIDEFFESRME